MKKALAVMLMSAMVLGVAAQSVAAEEVDEANYIYSAYFVPTNNEVVKFGDPITEAASEAVDGKISFTRYYSGELVPNGQEYDSLMNGTIDVTMGFNPNTESSRFPLTLLPLLPAFGATNFDLAEMVKEAIEDTEHIMVDDMTYNEYVFERMGVKAWPCAPNLTAEIGTTGVELDSLDALTPSVNIRTSNVVASMICENLGVTPVVVSLGELADAMSRNTVDGLFFPADWATWGIDPYVKYVIEGINLGQGLNYLMCTTEWWDAQPEAFKEAWEEEFPIALQDHAQAVYDLGQENNKAVADQGCVFAQFTDFPQEVQDHYNDACVKAWFDWIDEVEAQGAPAKNACIMWRDLLIKHGVEVPEALMDLENYTPNA